MSRRYFTILCTISRNEYRIKTSILINTGVNSFAFMNSSFAMETAKFLDVKVIRLPRLISIRVYDDELNNTITYALILNLTIDERR